MSFIPLTGGPVLIWPQRGLGKLHPQVVVEESHEDSLQITEHPVEQGAAISDHAFKRPKRVTIQAGVSDSGSGGGANPSREFYNKLLELQEKREPFDIVTGKRVYSNMLLENLAVTTNADTEYALKFTAQCREVIIAKTRHSIVPPSSRHASPGKTAPVSDRGQLQARRQ